MSQTASISVTPLNGDQNARSPSLKFETRIWSQIFPCTSLCASHPIKQMFWNALLAPHATVYNRFSPHTVASPLLSQANLKNLQGCLRT